MSRWPKPEHYASVWPSAGERGIVLSTMHALFGLDAMSSQATSQATFGDTRAILMPVRLPWVMRVEQLFVANGSSVGGSVDLGIYVRDPESSHFTRLVSTGSTPQSGANANQVIALGSPLVLVPGLYYYLALGIISTTGHIWRWLVGQQLAQVAAGGWSWIDAGAMPLPATITNATRGAPAMLIGAVGAGLP